MPVPGPPPVGMAANTLTWPPLTFRTSCVPVTTNKSPFVATAYCTLAPRLAFAAGPGIPLPSSLPLPATVVTMPVSPRAAVADAVVDVSDEVVVELAAVVVVAALLPLPPHAANTRRHAPAPMRARRSGRG